MEDTLHQILEKHGFWQTIRTTSCVARLFQKRKKRHEVQVVCPLTTSETDRQVKFWVGTAENSRLNTDTFHEDQLKLNLQKKNRVSMSVECKSKESYPIYLPPDALFTERIVHDKHVLTVHGGVGLTMSFARQQYWVPRIEQHTERVIRGCYGCKKFQVAAFSNPPAGKLPSDRREGSGPFQVVGLDFARPTGYKLKTKKEGKAYILSFACFLTRAVHFELQPKQNAEEIIRHLKWFITRKGHPRKI